MKCLININLNLSNIKNKPINIFKLNNSIRFCTSEGTSKINIVNEKINIKNNNADLKINNLNIKYSLNTNKLIKSKTNKIGGKVLTLNVTPKFQRYINNNKNYFTSINNYKRNKDYNIEVIKNTEKLYNKYIYKKSLSNFLNKRSIFKKFDTRTFGEKYALKKNKPLVPLHSPLDILKQDTNLIYKYDTIQLIECIKHINLNTKNISNLLFLLNVIRKKKELKCFEMPEILNSVYFIIENIYKLSLSYKINIFFCLSKMNYFNNDKSIVYLILNAIIKDINNLIIIKSKFNNCVEIDGRLLSNLISGMANYYKINKKDFNFDNIFYYLEEILIKNVAYLIKTNNTLLIDSFSISSIISSYSKTQSGSQEFYRFMADLITDLEISKPKELASIVYSYSNNENCNDKILFSLYNIIISNMHNAKVVELVTILRAYNNKKLLDELPDIIEKFLKNYYAKFKYANTLDIAYTYNILAPKFYKLKLNAENLSKDNNFKISKFSNLSYNYSLFFDCLHSQIKNLTFAFESQELVILLERAQIIFCTYEDLYNQLCNQIRYLLKKNKFKGKELDTIHYNIKDLYLNNSKYNYIKEEIEIYLRKIKYYI